MPVRRKPNGRWYFRSQVRMPDGTRQRISGVPGIPGPFHDLAQSKVGAQEAERRAIAEALRGPAAPVAKAEPKPEVETIRSYSVTFLEKFAAAHKPSEQRSKRQILDGHLLPVFGNMKLDEIRQEHVDDFANAERKRGMKVHTINNRLAVLSSLLRYAIRNGAVAAPSIPMTFKVNGMVGELNAVPMEDVEKLIEAAGDDRYRVVVLLAAEAGLRAGEILGLQWGDLKDGLLTVRRAIDKDTGEVTSPKHDRIRHVPLSPRLKLALEALPRLGLWVVSRLDGTLLRYAGLIDAVGLVYGRAKVTKPPKPVHCLRHTFGSVMAGKGCLPTVLQVLMGHADIKTTMRYVHVNEAQKRQAIESVFAWHHGGTEAESEKKKPSKP